MRPSARFTNIRSCRRYVRSLGLADYASAEELCAQLSSLRGRPIHVIDWELPIPGPLGVWIAREADDIVVVQRQATGSHRDHIVLHEIAHMVCEHAGVTLDDESSPAVVDSLTSEGAVLRFRTAYDTVCEREAELLAGAFAERLGSGAGTHLGSALDDYFSGD